jgi:hypothetical protein
MHYTHMLYKYRCYLYLHCVSDELWLLILVNWPKHRCSISLLFEGRNKPSWLLTAKVQYKHMETINESEPANRNLNLFTWPFSISSIIYCFCLVVAKRS